MLVEESSPWNYSPLGLNYIFNYLYIIMASTFLAGDLFTKTSEKPMATKQTQEGSKVPHIQQKTSWDCGLACCLMILTYGFVSSFLNHFANLIFRFLGKSQADWKSINRAVGTDSVWSIDLAFLLKSYGVQFSYNTITIGVKEEYSTMVNRNSILGTFIPANFLLV